MVQCPVCKKENHTLQCSACGFDISQDYEGYPTLVPLKKGLPARRGKSTGPSKLFRCKKCGGGIFYLHPDEDLCVCFKCGLEAPIPRKSQQPPAPAPAPAVKPAAKQLTTYDSYIRELERRYLDGGKKPLSQQQIDDFIREHRLDKQFQIRSGDVRRDLETIYAGHRPQISSYADYMKALEEQYIQNGRKPLSSAQIQDFLDANSLRKKFGITAADVNADLKTLEAKHKQYSDLAGVLRQKSDKDAASLGGVLSRLMKKKT